jgi:Ca2+/Na+ antiporter
MNLAVVGSIVGSVAGLLGGIIGTYVGYTESSGPRERSLIAKAVLLIVVVTAIGLVVVFTAPPVYRIITGIALFVIALFLSKKQAAVRREEQASKP